MTSPEKSSPQENNKTPEKPIIRFEDIQGKIEAEVTKRLRDRGCSPDQYQILPGFINPTLPAELSNQLILGGRTLPLIAVLNKNSGEVLFYALKALVAVDY